MDVRKVPMQQIKPHPMNPRKDLKPGDADFERIRRSIEHFGFVEPLVWNQRTGHLVGGHQRFKVLQEAGLKEVTVSVVDLDPDDEAMFAIALNKVRGDWEPEKLVELLRQIAQTGIDVTLTGFDPVDFELPSVTEEEPNEGASGEDEDDLITCPSCGAKFAEWELS